MTSLPNSATTINLLEWVFTNPNKPFDPNMVISADHTSDWQWQAVLDQMERLRAQTYITKLKQDPHGSTYWTITPRGENYLGALKRAEYMPGLARSKVEDQGAPAISMPIETGLPVTEIVSPPLIDPPSPTIASPVITKIFEAPSVALNGTARLIFTIRNPNIKSKLTEVSFFDVLPEGLVVSSPSNLVGSWAEGELAALAGSDRISLSGAVLPPGESCTFQLSVRAISSGRKDNHTSTVSCVEGGIGGGASASIFVFPAVGTTASDGGIPKPAGVVVQIGIDRFSEQVRMLFARADQLRQERQTEMMSIADVMRALAENKNGQLATMLAESKLELESIFKKAMQSSTETMDGASIVYMGSIPISNNVHLAIITAQEKANERNSEVKEEHVLYGVLSIARSKTVQALNIQGITQERIIFSPPTRAAKTAFVQAGYKSDDPTGDDFLDIDKDVDALASVLAAKEADPPLSLGLFGDWGTGKSFFMRRLEARIRALTDDAKLANGESQYCQDVVQITFNAWNYIDKDLWASLAAEIFEGLAAALASKRGGDSPGERALALAAASSSPAVVAETERQKDQAETRLKEAEDQLTELQRSQVNISRRLSAREVLTQAARFAVKDADVRKNAREAAKEIGAAESLEEAGRLQSQILELNNIWAEIVFTMRNNSSLWVWVTAFLVAFGLGLAVRGLAKNDHLHEAAKDALAFLTFASGFVATFLAGSRKVLSFVRRIRESKQELISRTRKAIKEKIDQTQETVEEAAEAVKVLNRQLENMRADRQMVDFIRRRYESSDYRENLGTIARVRADFKHLSTLLRDVRKESEKELEEIKARQAEKEKERKEKDTNASPLFPRIDRIILYIDDLDRCQEKNVVDVLQAVHLLLAFPLFVVVVGVDPRWLLHSLQQHTSAFQEDNKSDEGSENREEDLRWQSTPLNYLEKIFQLPFTLRPIGKSGFEQFVNAFAAPRIITTERFDSAPQPQFPAHEKKANEGPLLGYAKEAKPADQEAKNQAPPIQNAALPISQPIDRHPEHLRIEERERVFMKTLYELIPSPRAGKRFINIYRLLRASVEDKERDGFVGNDGGGEYQCALMLLAILTGYPAEATEILGTLLKEQYKGKTWKQFLESLLAKMHKEKNVAQGAPTSESRPERSGGQAFIFTAPDTLRWEELFTKLDRIENNLNDRLCEGFVRWAPRVARYSFQSGRVLLHQREQ
jgi:hypothetical protein